MISQTTLSQTRQGRAGTGRDFHVEEVPAGYSEDGHSQRLGKHPSNRGVEAGTKAEFRI